MLFVSQSVASVKFYDYVQPWLTIATPAVAVASCTTWRKVYEMAVQGTKTDEKL